MLRQTVAKCLEFRNHFPTYNQPGSSGTINDTIISNPLLHHNRHISLLIPSAILLFVDTRTTTLPTCSSFPIQLLHSNLWISVPFQCIHVRQYFFLFPVTILGLHRLQNVYLESYQNSFITAFVTPTDLLFPFFKKSFSLLSQ